MKKIVLFLIIMFIPIIVNAKTCESNKIKIDSKLDRMDCKDSIKFSSTEIEPRFLNNEFTKKLKRINNK